MNSKFALGVDIGGTHITTALVDTGSAVLLPETQYRTMIDSSGKAGDIIESWAAAIRQSWMDANIDRSSVGIAMPGPFDYNNGICLINKQDKYQGLYGVNVKEQLSARLGIAPADLRFMNDASSFLKGELVAGSVRGCERAVGITLGTGLGSAYYKEQLLTDADLWRMPFLDGIAEDYLSTRWFVQEYAARYGKIIKGVKDLTAHNILPEESAPLFETFAGHLAQFITIVTEQLHCYNIVIGGNIVLAAPYFWQQTCNTLAQLNCPAVLTISRLGETAPIIGAAAMFQKEIIEKANLD